MVIKEGYASEPFEIKVFGRDDGVAEVWTEMFDGMKHSDHELTGDIKSNPKFRTEVMHYAKLDELIALRNEINQAIKVLAGI